MMWAFSSLAWQG